MQPTLVTSLRSAPRSPSSYAGRVRLLVVEDEERLAGVLSRALVREGYAVDVAPNGLEALWFGRENDYDAIVLDVMIPPPDGFEVVRQLRGSERWAPVLMLTARDQVTDRVVGLDAGADDYLTKPFAVRELAARVRALTRRALPARPSVLRVDDLTLDQAIHRVQRGSQEISLSPKEYALLLELMRHPGQPLTRAHLIEHVWDFAFDASSNVVDVYIGYLRDKLDRPFGVHSIETVRGVGYRIGDADCAPIPDDHGPGSSR
jgi:two-component system OmpR family response regulator